MRSSVSVIRRNQISINRRHREHSFWIFLAFLLCRRFAGCFLFRLTFLLPQMLKGSVALSRLSLSDSEVGLSAKQGTDLFFLTEGGAVLLSQPDCD